MFVNLQVLHIKGTSQTRERSIMVWVKAHISFWADSLSSFCLYVLLVVEKIARVNCCGSDANYPELAKLQVKKGAILQYKDSGNW